MTSKVGGGIRMELLNRTRERRSLALLALVLVIVFLLSLAYTVVSCTFRS